MRQLPCIIVVVDYVETEPKPVLVRLAVSARVTWFLLLFLRCFWESQVLIFSEKVVLQLTHVKAAPENANQKTLIKRYSSKNNNFFENIFFHDDN